MKRVNDVSSVLLRVGVRIRVKTSSMGIKLKVVCTLPPPPRPQPSDRGLSWSVHYSCSAATDGRLSRPPRTSRACPSSCDKRTLHLPQETSTAARDENGQGTDEQGDSNGEGGLDWLTSVATGNSTASVTSAQATEPSAAPAVNGSAIEDDDWLAVAKSTSQASRHKSHNSSPATRSSAAAAPAAPGGWMSSGKLGLPTGGGSDEGDAGETGDGSTNTKNRKKQPRKAASSAGGPTGWLGSGALGVPAEDGSDEEDVGDGDGGGGGGNGDGRGVGVTIETQTEDDIQAVTEKGAIEKDKAPKLPPWAKPWVPPPKPEVEPDDTPEVTSAPAEETKKQVTEKLWLIVAVAQLPAAVEPKHPEPTPSAPTMAYLLKHRPPSQGFR